MPPQWQEWLGCVDVVQLNENEGALLAGEELDSEEARRLFAEKVLALGPSSLIITRRSEGSETISKEDDLIVERFDSVPHGEPCDETGCGDTFLMGYTWAFLQTAARALAAQFANRVAGINVCLRGIDGIGQIGQFLKPEDRFAASQS